MDVAHSGDVAMARREAHHGPRDPRCPVSAAGLRGAEANIAHYAAGCTAQIELRRGDGLLALAPGEADVVTMSGIGHKKMRRLLEEGRLASRAIETLVKPQVFQLA